MLEFMKRLFQRSEFPAGAGITPVDKHIQDCAELIRRCVVAQFNEAGLPLLSRTASYRPVVLGYVATFAEQMGLGLRRDDPQSASVLICLLAMDGVDAEPDQEALLREFTELTESRNYSFGQGGAIALEDFPGVLKQVPPRRLALELMSNR